MQMRTKRVAYSPEGRSMKSHTRLGAILFCCSLGLFGADSALAQWMDGEDLARVCDPGQQGHIFRPGVCSGYIMAAIDLDEYLTGAGIIKKPLFCMPENVPMSQVNAVVTSYIKAHPEREDDSAAMLVIDALGGKFPCKD
jgi:hypothetical protein